MAEHLARSRQVRPAALHARGVEGPAPVRLGAVRRRRAYVHRAAFRDDADAAADRASAQRATGSRRTAGSGRCVAGLPDPAAEGWSAGDVRTACHPVIVCHLRAVHSKEPFVALDPCPPPARGDAGLCPATADRAGRPVRWPDAQLHRERPVRPDDRGRSADQPGRQDDRLCPPHRRRDDRHDAVLAVADRRRERSPDAVRHRRQQPALVARRRAHRLCRARRRRIAAVRPLDRRRAERARHELPRRSAGARLVAGRHQARLYRDGSGRGDQARHAAAQARGREMGRAADDHRPGQLPQRRAGLCEAGLRPSLRGRRGRRCGAAADLSASSTMAARCRGRPMAAASSSPRSAGRPPTAR